MVANDTCQWLFYYKKELCGKRCENRYCFIHLWLIRRGSTITQPCSGCGVGVSNKFGRCKPCGYMKESTLYNMRKFRAFRKEAKRLGRIDV